MASLPADVWCSNGIEVKNLSLEHSQRVGTDAWGRKKEQPTSVTVRLALRSAFTSAAASDALDESTMHYGHLAKRLRGVRPSAEWQGLGDLAQRLHESICDSETAQRLLTECEVAVNLPKATLLGDCVILRSRRSYRKDRQGVQQYLTLHLSQVNIATLIGVNAHEREHKQPLVFDVSIYDLPVAASGIYVELEAELVKIVEPTGFETLESLVIHIVNGLYANLLARELPEVSLRLRVEKPMAVSFADAPVIEIYRTAEQMRNQLASAR